MSYCTSNLPFDAGVNAGRGIRRVISWSAPEVR